MKIQIKILTPNGAFESNPVEVEFTEEEFEEKKNKFLTKTHPLGISFIGDFSSTWYFPPELLKLSIIIIEKENT